MKGAKGILSMDADTDMRRTLAGVLRNNNLMTVGEKQVIARLEELVHRRFTSAEADLICMISIRKAGPCPINA